MSPLTDIHCHLLAGLDDGPRTMDEAVEMCRMAWNEGTRVIAATAHMGEQWPDVTADRIRTAAGRLIAELGEIGLPLAVFSVAEITVQPDLDHLWKRGELLSVADRDTYLMIEMPPGLFIDLRDTVGRLRALRVRPILAHPERHPELLYEEGVVEELISMGCLMQVSANSIADSTCRKQLGALERWTRRGIVHLIGSDGHSPKSRPPRIARAYRCIAQWAGTSTADRICSTNGLTVLQGLPLGVPEPEPTEKTRWFFRFDKLCGLHRAYYRGLQHKPPPTA